jgi:hypothetical protein
MQKKNGPSKTERVRLIMCHDGKVAIVRMNAATVSVGDELILLRGKRSAFAKIQAIQSDDVAVDSFVATGGEKLGIELSHRHGRRSFFVELRLTNCDWPYSLLSNSQVSSRRDVDS